MDEFESFWTKNFAAAPPLSFVLRSEYGSRWIRLHSLPKSKRYATSSEDDEIVASRANELATKVLNGDECWLVAGVFDAPDIGGTYKPANQPNLELTKSFVWPESDIGGDAGDEWAFYALRTHWKPGAFDGLLQAVAEDQAPKILWVSLSTKGVFAPYDGGFDLILPDPAHAEKFRVQYSHWAPARRNGL